MNTFQINHALRNKLGSDIFRGTFALNQAPLSYTLNPPFGMIINTEPVTEEGDHWIALYHEQIESPFEIFDSRGFSEDHRYIHHILKSLRIDQYTMNRFPLQSVCSSVCGEYCLFFLYCRAALGMSYAHFLTFFSEKNLFANDHFIYNIVHKHFEILNYPRKVPPLYPKNMCIQIAKSFE
jgi:hypothetical protein